MEGKRERGELGGGGDRQRIANTGKKKKRKKEKKKKKKKAGSFFLAIKLRVELCLQSTGRLGASQLNFQVEQDVTFKTKQ